MMKRIYTLGMILMIGQMAIAQFSHNFKLERGAMIDLQHPTEVGARELITDLEGESFRIGFDFNFGGPAIANVLRFTEDGMLEAFDSNERVTLFTLSPMMGVDLIDRGMSSNIKESSVFYELMGDPGNYKLVVQWRNVGLQAEYEAFHTTDDFMNFQVVLSQDNNKVEYTYGQSKISNTELYFNGSGPMVGLASEKFETQLYLYKLSNNPKPTSELANLNRFPQFGMSYAFVPNLDKDEPTPEVKLAQTTKLDAKIYPNPFANDFSIKLLKGIPGAKVLVRSPYGKVVFEGMVDRYVNIDLTGFDSGLYVIQISDRTDTIFKKVMKR